MEDEIVQYLIINSDLVMSSGKIAAQAAHAATMTTYKLAKESYSFSLINMPLPKHIEYFEQWFSNNQKKIVLKASEKEMRELISKYGESGEIVYVIDNGHTEIPPDSLTVIAFNPMPKAEAREQYINKRWRLY